MKLWNALMTWILSVSLSLAPQVLKAQDDISSLVESEIGNAETLDLSTSMQITWEVKEISEWEEVYVLYPTKSKKWEDVGIFIPWIPYNKKEMGDCKIVLYYTKTWKFVTILIANDDAEIPWTDFFTIVKL